MKFDFNELIRSAKEPHDENFRNRIYVFSVCLAISVFLWFLIVLSKDYFVTIDYPVTFENIPHNLVLTNKPDSIINITLSSGGFELVILKYLTRKKPVVINLSELKPLQVAKNRFEIVVNTKNLKNKILQRYNIQASSATVFPERIEFFFESLQKKKVKVIPKLNLQFEKMYLMVDSLEVQPDSVEITGSIDKISRYNTIPTVKKEITGINNDMTLTIPIDRSDLEPGINVYPGKVTIKILVEKYTEATILVPLSTPENDTIKVKSFPEEIKITYLVSLKNFKRVDKDMFILSVNLDDDPGNTGMLPVKVVHSPGFVKITKIEPSKVEYLVLKK